MCRRKEFLQAQRVEVSPVGRGQPGYDVVMGGLGPGDHFMISREREEGFNGGAAKGDGLLRKWPEERWQGSQRLHAGASECEPKVHAERFAAKRRAKAERTTETVTVNVSLSRLGLQLGFALKLRRRCSWSLELLARWSAASILACRFCSGGHSLASQTLAPSYAWLQSKLWAESTIAHKIYTTSSAGATFLSPLLLL